MKNHKQLELTNKKSKHSDDSHPIAKPQKKEKSVSDVPQSHKTGVGVLASLSVLVGVLQSAWGWWQAHLF